MSDTSRQKIHIGGLILTRCTDDEVVAQTPDGSGCRLRADGYGELEQELFYVLADAILKQQAQAEQPPLTVWYGSMPESNGRSNFTAILYRKGGDIVDGITIDRSEYPDRVRYEADRLRYLIGELKDRPWILDYDADRHSGYIEQQLQSPITDAAIRLAELMRGLGISSAMADAHPAVLFELGKAMASKASAIDVSAQRTGDTL